MTSDDDLGLDRDSDLPSKTTTSGRYQSITQYLRYVLANKSSLPALGVAAVLLAFFHCAEMAIDQSKKGNDPDATSEGTTSLANPKNGQ